MPATIYSSDLSLACVKSCLLLIRFRRLDCNRQTEEEVKAVSTKKQKVEEVAAKQKALKVVKKEESSSEESSDESEDEKPVAKAPAPSKKTPAKNGNVISS